MLGTPNSLKNQVTKAEQEQPGFQRWLMVQLTQRLLPMGQGHSVYTGHNARGVTWLCRAST